MLPFHIHLHALPPHFSLGSAVVVKGIEVNSLRWSAPLSPLPMAVSFEEATQQLQLLPRCFIEPDGSFVWVSPVDEDPAWQVDGNLYDRDGRLVRVELKGNCPAQRLDHLLAICGHQITPLMVEFVPAAVFVTVDEFRGWLQRSGASAA